MEKCFGDYGEKCFALTRKNCEGCEFYKPKHQALKELKLSPNYCNDETLQEIAKIWEA